MTTEPTLRSLSLGAGVQSTTLALLAVEGTLPKPDIAIFADTGWEPGAVYRQVDRIAEALVAAGIEFVRVSNGNLRADALDPCRGGSGMTVCVYPTVLDKPCGRQAVRRARWQQQHRSGPEVHDWPLCPFHQDLQMAELLLSCDVHSLALLTLEGELILPTHLPPESPLWPVAVVGIAELLQLVNARGGQDAAQTRRTA